MRHKRKMEHIAALGAGVGFLVALIGGLIKLKKWITTAIKDTLKDELGDLKKDIEDLSKEIRKEDKEKTKNFLVARLAEIERGESWSDIERQRFYEQFDHYTKDLDGNTYIKTATEKYETEGKIWRSN